MKKFLLGLVFLFTMVAGGYVYGFCGPRCAESGGICTTYNHSIRSCSGPSSDCCKYNAGGGGGLKPDDIYNGPDFQQI